MNILTYIGTEFGLRSSKGNNRTASREESSKRCPQNGMTRKPSYVWPNAVVPYIFDTFISEP